MRRTPDYSTHQSQLEAFYASQGCDTTGRKLLPTMMPTTMPVPVISEETPKKLSFFGKLFGRGKDCKKTDLPDQPSPFKGFASGGGGGCCGGGAALAVAGGGGRKSTSKPKMSHPHPSCGHWICEHLHSYEAGHGAIVLPCFNYHSKDGSIEPVVILGFERGSWNLFCEGMKHTDCGCWLECLMRTLREECKLILTRPIQVSDVKLGPIIGTKTPSFYVELDSSMVSHHLSRGVLNAHVASDNANPALPKDYKEIQAIGFFKRRDNDLFSVPGNPHRSTFSDVVRTWLKESSKSSK
jgi:hypothetical protein